METDMNIDQLSEYVYEDLNGRITCVDCTEDFVIHFQCDDLKEDGVIRKFSITCHGVRESEVQTGFSGTIYFSSDHQLLWRHNEPQGYLYYTSKASNQYELLGKLWEQNEKIFGGWKHLADSVNTYNAGHMIEFCKDSNGLLAQGPRPLLEEFQKVASEYLNTNYVVSYMPDGGCKALIFDSSYVICRAVTVNEIT